MGHPRPRHFLRTYLACLLGLTAIVYSGWGQAAWAGGRTFVSELVQTIDTSAFIPPSPDTAGITYLPASDRLLASDSEVNEPNFVHLFTGKNVFQIDLLGDLDQNCPTLTTIPFSDEPTGLALNQVNGHLFVSDDTVFRIFEWDRGADLCDPADDTTTSFKTGDFGSFDPEGVAFDSVTGLLYLVDGMNSEVYQIDPGANGRFDGVPPAGDDQVTSFDTASLGVTDPEGITFDSDSGNLYVIGTPRDSLLHVSTGGILVQMIDVSAAHPKQPAGLAYAPSSVNPSVMNVYIAARGVDNDFDPNENDGKIYEVTTPGPNAMPWLELLLLDD